MESTIKEQSNDLLLGLEEKIKRLEAIICNIDRRYQASNEMQLELIRVLRVQRRLIKRLRPPSLYQRAKTLFRPKIGVLYQYKHSRKVSIPDRYHKPLTLHNPPRISIVTPSFNQGQYLEKTILSITKQNYPNLEYIIQDGGSTDTSVAVMNRYSASLKHWESKKDTGQSNALNLGFQHATGEIMAYLNSDDILLPGCLNYVADYFSKHPEIDVVYGHRVVINQNDMEIGRWVLPPHNEKVLTWADYVPQETLFWRRSLWEKAGSRIDETFKFAMDWDLILRFQKAGARFVRLPRFLGAFRAHIQQKTSAIMSEIGEEEMERLRRSCHGRAVTTVEINKNLRWYRIQHLVYHRLYRAGLLQY